MSSIAKWRSSDLRPRSILPVLHVGLVLGSRREGERWRQPEGRTETERWKSGDLELGETVRKQNNLPSHHLHPTLARLCLLLPPHWLITVAGPRLAGDQEQTRTPECSCFLVGQLASFSLTPSTLTDALHFLAFYCCLLFHGHKMVAVGILTGSLIFVSSIRGPNIFFTNRQHRSKPRHTVPSTRKGTAICKSDK